MKSNGIARPMLIRRSFVLTNNGRKIATQLSNELPSRVSRNIARRISTIIPSYHYQISEMHEMEDQLIIVNENDEIVGFGPKLKVHREGLLHRAFSIFIFNSDRELILQRRALTKYHSPGLWSNTCCGHPTSDEHILDAAQRRMKSEMGLSCQLEAFGSFVYRADVGNCLIEHEFDHLLIGYSELDPVLNIDEAIAWRRVPLATLEQEVRDCPNDFTSWLRIIMDAGLLPFPILIEAAKPE